MLTPAEVVQRSHLLSVSGALVLDLLLSTAPARADEPRSAHSLRWDPAWTHAGAWDYSLSAVGATVLVADGLYFQERQAPARFYGPILFDAGARNFFRGSAAEARIAAANVSWALWALDVLGPLAIDVPYSWARYGREVAWDLVWQDATTLLLASSVDVVLRDVIGRVRPNDSDCLAAGKTGCLTPEAVRSFPSGHMTEVVTGASLFCTQHLMLGIYGAPWDAIGCSVAIASTAAVGVLRMVADDHWGTDILGSTALGILFGWGTPYLMHLRGHAPGRPAEGAPILLPWPVAVDHGAGVGILGIL